MKKFYLFGFILLLSCTKPEQPSSSAVYNHQTQTQTQSGEEWSYELSNQDNEFYQSLSDHDKAIRDMYDEIASSDKGDDYRRQAYIALIPKARTIENQRQREFILHVLYFQAGIEQAYQYNEELIKERPTDWGLIGYRCHLQELLNYEGTKIQQCYQSLVPYAKDEFEKLDPNSKNYPFEFVGYQLILHKAGDESAKKRAIDFIENMKDGHQKEQFKPMLADEFK